MRISPIESLRIPEEGSSTQGKSGPKPRPEGVGDGQLVEIPVPPIIVIREVGTQKDKLAYCWISTSKYVGRRDRQIRFFIILRYEWERK